jgi:gliding-associated putative ABC transporter substrate-binding component GldG
MNLRRILLLAGILLLINLLSRDYFFRWDLTQDKQYTLSKATKNILSELDEPITVTAYFTNDLPQQLVKTREDFRDLLEEYSSRSKGMINYEFIDPGGDPEKEQEAMQNGVSPLTINVREKDESVQKRAYLGALVKSESGQDLIPLVQPEGPMEYQLTTSIKKIASVDKPVIGLIQGYGEPGIQELSMLYQSLSILYSIEPIDLASQVEIPSRFKTLVWVKPLDSIPPAQFDMLDKYMDNGGNLCVAFDRVEGDFQTAQGTASNNGIAEWLSSYGLQIDPSFLLDARCGEIQVQQKQGFFTYSSSVKFPYFPLVTDFGENPITDGLEQVIFQLASPIRYNGDSASTFIPVAISSDKTGLLPAPLMFDVQRQWVESDFRSGSLPMGGILTRKLSNGLKTNLALYTDGDLPIGAQGRGQTSDNISLISNTVDYLSDDTGLIDLRTKGVTTRPIKELDDEERSQIKWINFLLPILLVVFYGIFRFQRNRRIRIRRMEERYV